MNRNSICAAVACSFVLSGVLPLSTKAGTATKGQPAPTQLIKVPMTRQATNYTCGVAALQSVLAYFGDDIREGALASELKSNSKIGTAYQQIARFARSKSYKVDVLKNMSIERLKGLLDKDQPVICLVQAWAQRQVDYSRDWNDGHYVVAIGYDHNKIYFMDPSTVGNYTYIPTDEFLARWHDTDGKERLVHFGMVLTKGKPAYDAFEFKKME